MVTNVDLSVFDDPLTKTSFETMFREYDCGASFHYLRCIRRIRVDFESHLTASVAKQKLDNTLVANNVIHCYFIQVSGAHILMILTRHTWRSRVTNGH